MNFSKRKSNFSIFAIAFSVAALTIAALPGLTNSIARASGAGLEVEVPFEIKALKTPGLVAPYFLQDNHGTMVVSDQAGGVYSVTFGGKATALADKTKIKNPAGVAIGPAGFGSYEGSVFVLAAAGGIKGPCEVERIDKSGAVSTFAKLPDAGATECRDLEFGAAGSPFRGQALRGGQRQLDDLRDRLVGQGERVRRLQQAGRIRADHDYISAVVRFESGRHRCWSGCARRETLRRRSAASAWSAPTAS